MQSTSFSCAFTVLVLVITAFFSSASAAPTGWYVGGGVGWLTHVSGNVGNTTLANNAPGMQAYPDLLINTQINDTVATNVQAGYQFSAPYRWLSAYRVGISYENTTQSRVSGNIDQMSDPSPAAKTETFGFNVNNQVFLVTGEGDFFNWRNLSTFLHLGLGASDNSAGSFSTSSQQDLLYYPSHSNVAFAYEVGPGVAYQIIPHLNVDLTALYQDFGSATLGNGYRQNILVTTPLNGISANYQSVEVRADVNYLF